MSVSHVQHSAQPPQGTLQQGITLSTGASIIGHSPPVSHDQVDHGPMSQPGPISRPAAPQHQVPTNVEPAAGAYPSRIFLDICSGSTRPLSAAVQKMGGDVCSIDILLCSTYDLLNDEFYLDLLKVAASGRIGYAACSPSCNEYSVLKLKPGGPPALRSHESHEFLDGFPDLDADQLSKVQNSHTMLFRCTEILQVVYSAGGHGHLEQPPSAMSWMEGCTRNWLLSGGHYCVHLAACAFQRDWLGFLQHLLSP